uniref:YopX protein n=1 Tax=Siphoviridae sp. ctVif31 TaxID=2825532 RepID=A0A8S5Q2Q2_9CAUD|nr:MAG TPA: YopX protein [Siphoviridae sp. ctVif31]
MREILFKAKRIDNGKWIEGYYQKRYDLLDNEEHLIFHADSHTVWEYAEVDSETLCQFTGLCDKNGNKIWENDILMAHLDEFYPEDVTYETVEWGVAGWAAHETSSIDREYGSVDREYLNEFDLKHFEVVGNIFDGETNGKNPKKD